MKFSLTIFLLTTAAFAQSPQKAIVHFYRERAYVGSLRKMPIFMDEQQIGDLVNGRFFVAKLDPGKHVFRSRARLEATTVELASGHDYYLRIDLREGWKNHWRLLLVTNEQGAGDIERLKPADAKDVAASVR
jgi:hypothetical protein